MGHVIHGRPAHWAVSWDVALPGIASTDLGTSVVLMPVSPETGLAEQEEEYFTDLPCLFLTGLHVITLWTHELSCYSLPLLRDLAQATGGVELEEGAHPMWHPQHPPTHVSVPVSPTRMSALLKATQPGVCGGPHLRLQALLGGNVLRLLLLSFYACLLGLYENTTPCSPDLGVKPDAYICQL